MNLRKIIKEEINEFDWVDSVRITLGLLFDDGVLKEGDVIGVKGRTMSYAEGSIGNMVSIEADFTIVEISGGGYGISDIMVSTDVNTSNILGADVDSFSLVDDDRNLEVLTYNGEPM